MAIQRVRPTFIATNLITGEERTARVVLEANRDHNTPRTARVERVVFLNDLTPHEALEAVCDREGELDIVTEVSPADAARVEASEHARLVSSTPIDCWPASSTRGRTATRHSATSGCARR